MAGFSSELSGSLIFNSASVQAALQPYNGGINISGSELYINQVGLDTRISSVEAGFVGSASLGPLNRHSASINLFTASIESFTGSTNSTLTALNTFTSSFSIRVTTLESDTSTYLTLNTLPAGTVSSSNQIETLGYLTSASAASTGFGDASLPAGTISSSAQISALGYTTSSDSTISASYSSTSSFATTASYVSATNIDGTIVSSSHAVTASYISPTFISESVAAAGFSDTTLPAGTISSSQQISDLGYITSSDGSSTDITALNTFTSSYYVDSASFDSRISAISAGDTSYSGDRIVSNEDLGDLYNNSFNAGTTGSIQDFLNAVFFPNTPPSFDTSPNVDVVEFATSGSTLVTLAATDSEGQAVTFALASSYTDGFVAVSSDGVVTSAVIPTEASFNTVDRGDGTLAHPVDIEVTDSFGSKTTQTFYFTVSVNTAPKFRQTSVGGTVITSFTSNRNENATAGEVGKIYFTDAESDTITITSASDPNGHFTLTKYSTYVQIDQVTGSLDYENITSYTMSITASDEHYPAQDADSITTLPITINVTDNLQPTINNQTLNSINEDSSTGATVDTIAASDNEGDTRTFFDFTLSKLELDNVDVPTGSYGGTSQASDPTENPFVMNSSGVVTRKAGAYLNSDLINEYQYTVKVKDSFNTASNSGTITIPISDDPAPFINDNWSGGPYVIESATTGDQIKTNSNGYSGTQARVTSNETVTWSTNSSLIQISGTGYLTMNTNVSGSYTSGQTFQADITASNTFGTENNTLVTFTVTENLAPVLTLTDLGLNSDVAISGSNIGSVSITDQETNTPYSVSLSGTDAASFNLVSNNAANSSLNIQPLSSLSAGTYSITASAEDTFGKIGSSSLGIVVSTASDYGKFYIYTSTRTGGGTLSSANYNGLLGIAGVDSSTPPEVTSLTADTTSPLYRIKSGDLGNSSITVGGGTLTRRVLTSGSSPASIVQSAGQFSGNGSTAEQILLIYPSGSDMTGIPLSIAESFGGSDVGDYVLNVNDAGAWANTINGATLNLLELDTAHEGYDHWYILGRTGTNTASTFEVRLTAESGSAPTS